MSWNERDYKGRHSVATPSVAEPHPERTFNDTDPLPSVAEFLGWGDDLGEELPARWTMEQERTMHAMGVISPQDWDVWGRIIRRGVSEV